MKYTKKEVSKIDKLNKYRVNHRAKGSMEERQVWFNSESRDTLVEDFKKAFPNFIFISAF